MATTTHRVTTSSTSNAASYASGSFTPAAGELLVVFVIAGATTATGSMTDSQGLGFTKVTSAVADTSADTIYCFVANALAAASSMTVTFDCTGDNADGCVIFVAGVAGMFRTGSQAIKQSAIASNGTASTAPATTFGASALTGNPTLCGVINASNPSTVKPGTGWTQAAGTDTGYNTPTTGATYIYRDSGFTGTTITCGTTSPTIWGMVSVELDTSGPTVLGVGGSLGALGAGVLTAAVTISGAGAPASEIGGGNSVTFASFVVSGTAAIVTERGGAGSLAQGGVTVSGVSPPRTIAGGVPSITRSGVTVLGIGAWVDVEGGSTALTAATFITVFGVAAGLLVRGGPGTSSVAGALSNAYAVVSGSLAAPTGEAIAGARVVFTLWTPPTAVVRTTVDEVEVDPTPVIATTNAAGSFSVVLVRGDASVPAGVRYQVEGPTFRVTIRAPTSATADLRDLV